MKYSPTGIEVGGKSDTILIFGILAVAGVVLWKTGIFDTLKDSSKVVDTALGAANTVVTDVANLPANIGTLIKDIPQLPLAIAQAQSTPLTQQSIFNAAIQGKIATFPGSASISQRTANMIDSVYHRYEGVTYLNWGQIAAANGAKFDSNGFIISDNSGTVNSTGLSTLTINGVPVNSITGGAR